MTYGNAWITNMHVVMAGIPLKNSWCGCASRMHENRTERLGRYEQSVHKAARTAVTVQSCLHVHQKPTQTMYAFLLCAVGCA